MAYTDPSRARIPGTIQGYKARDRASTIAATEAERQDNWAKHFGGATSKETADAAEVKARVAVMEKNQDVEDKFRANRGLPPVGGAAAPATATAAAPAPAAPAAPKPAVEAIKQRAIVQPPAGASMGITERGGVGGSDVRYKDGTTITGTPAKRVLASKYGEGSSTITPQPSPMPAASPLAATVKAASQIPVVGKAVDAVRRMVGGGQKISAPVAPTSSPAPAAPKGSTPTRSGGYMSITGAPKPAPAAPQPTEMQRREATAQQRIREKIYPETAPKAVARRASNAALVRKYRMGDRAFEQAKQGMSPRDRLRLTASLAHAAY